MKTYSSKVGILCTGILLVILCDVPVHGIQLSNSVLALCGPGKSNGAFCRALVKQLESLESKLEQKVDVIPDWIIDAEVKRSRCIPGLELSWWCRSRRENEEFQDIKNAITIPAPELLSPSKRPAPLGLQDCPTDISGAIDPVCIEKRRRQKLQSRAAAFGNRCIPGNEFNFFCRGKKSNDDWSTLSGKKLDMKDPGYDEYVIKDNLRR
ncbi:uncharacterized protein LOC144453778 isoform X2 [Glandiceps talaboti]